MATIADSNQFDVLATATPTTQEQKTWEAAGRGLKDDVKQQAQQAKTQIKGKAAQLQEQVISTAKQGAQLAKEKAAQLTGNPKIVEASNEELLAEGQDAAAEGWEEVKRRGNKAVKETERQLDEKLTPEQKAKLAKAKQAGAKTQRKAEGLFASVLSAPQLRPARRFIEQNRLQLPVLLLVGLLTLALGASVLRLLVSSTQEPTPEFDIHSLEASKAWARHHAGEYKNQAVDLKESLTSRAAHFLANTPNLDTIRTQAVDWKDIGVKKLGLAEPTWGEWALHYVTGRPLSWKGRVLSVLDLAKTGIQHPSASSKLAKGAAHLHAARGAINAKLGLREPTLAEKVSAWFTGADASFAARAEAEARAQAASLSDRVGAAADSLKANLADGVHSIKSRIPGRAEEVVEPSTIESLKAKAAEGVASIKARIPGRAEEVVEPSTIDNLKAKLAGGAAAIKSRIPGQAEEVVEPSTIESLKAKLAGGAAAIKAHIPGHAEEVVEPSTIESLKANLAEGVASLKARIPGHAEEVVEPSTIESLQAKLAGGLDSLKAHIPGTAEAKAAAELAQAKLAAATHRSTLDKVASQAEYVKNRIVHGAEEAQHIAQDKANKVMDEAKLKAGL